MLNVEFKITSSESCAQTFNGTGPSYLSECFIKASDVHHHFTRGSTEKIVVPSVSGVAATTFYYSVIKDWNSLPSDVKQSKKEGKDQESIQSSTTPDPGYQWKSNKVHFQWFQICFKTNMFLKGYPLKAKIAPKDLKPECAYFLGQTS